MLVALARELFYFESPAVKNAASPIKWAAVASRVRLKKKTVRCDLFVKACKFLVAMPDGAATVNEDNVDVVRTEIERLEALPPLVLTIQDLDGSNEEITATVARWDRIGASLPKALEHQYYRVTWLLFGGIELTLTDRWEEGAEEIEDGVSVPPFCCVSVNVVPFE
jgi:hypothetical protein